MISTGKWPVRVAASALLPLAVGPMSRIAAGSAATHEQFVEIGEAHLKPGRAAVVALAGALGFLHLAQQGVHRAGIERSLESFVKDALVRGVHVDQYQPLLVLSEDIDAVQLREREAERRRAGRARVFGCDALQCSGALAGAPVRKHGGIARD